MAAVVRQPQLPAVGLGLEFEEAEHGEPREEDDGEDDFVGVGRQSAAPPVEEALGGALHHPAAATTTATPPLAFKFVGCHFVSQVVRSRKLKPHQPK